MRIESADVREVLDALYDSLPAEDYTAVQNQVTSNGYALHVNLEYEFMVCVSSKGGMWTGYIDVDRA
jgi:hypothetical protein